MAQTSVLSEGDVVDVTLQQRAMALGGAPTLATLNNGGAVATLPRHALKGMFPWRIMLEFRFQMFEINTRPFNSRIKIIVQNPSCVG